MVNSQPLPSHGLTPNEAARYLRVNADKIRLWIRRGELGAVNLGTHARPRFVVLPQHLAEFARLRSAAAPRPAPRRRRQPTATDYYPD